MKKSVADSEKPVKAKEFDKELFKRSVEYNVRTLYRKNLEEADAQQTSSRNHGAPICIYQ